MVVGASGSRTKHIGQTQLMQKPQKPKDQGFLEIPEFRLGDYYFHRGSFGQATQKHGVGSPPTADENTTATVVMRTFVASIQGFGGNPCPMNTPGITKPTRCNSSPKK